MLIQISKEIIEELENTGLKLTITQKEIIINKVYDAIKVSYVKRQNWCNCRQPCCSYCN